MLLLTLNQNFWKNQKIYKLKKYQFLKLLLLYKQKFYLMKIYRNPEPRFLKKVFETSRVYLLILTTGTKFINLIPIGCYLVGTIMVFAVYLTQPTSLEDNLLFFVNGSQNHFF
uniref:Uncharacterized protein n=1 Tax=Halimeda minima TaxID=170427 RepID=A0A386AZ08_9CHLO|nr:hypothetical protein [Halimeda minima]